MSVVSKVILSPRISESITLDYSLFPMLRIALLRHFSGDFGEVSRDLYLKSILGHLIGGRVTSKYSIEYEESNFYEFLISIITDQDKITTISFEGEL